MIIDKLWIIKFQAHVRYWLVLISFFNLSEKVCLEKKSILDWNGICLRCFHALFSFSGCTVHPLLAQSKWQCQNQSRRLSLLWNRYANCLFVWNIQFFVSNKDVVQVLIERITTDVFPVESSKSQSTPLVKYSPWQIVQDFPVKGRIVYWESWNV